MSDFRVNFYERQIGRLAQRLRDLADQVERDGRPYDRPGATGTPRFLAAAERVNHAMTWGFANASAYALTEAAYHADESEREAS